MTHNVNICAFFGVRSRLKVEDHCFRHLDDHRGLGLGLGVGLGLRVGVRVRSTCAIDKSLGWLTWISSYQGARHTFLLSLSCPPGSTAGAVPWTLHLEKNTDDYHDLGTLKVTCSLFSCFTSLPACLDSRTSRQVPEWAGYFIEKKKDRKKSQLLGCMTSIFHHWFKF